MNWLPGRPRTVAEFFPASALIGFGIMYVVFDFAKNPFFDTNYLHPFLLIFYCLLFVLGIWWVTKAMGMRHLFYPLLFLFGFAIYNMIKSGVENHRYSWIGFPFGLVFVCVGFYLMWNDKRNQRSKVQK